MPRERERRWGKGRTVGYTRRNSEIKEFEGETLREKKDQMEDETEKQQDTCCV